RRATGAAADVEDVVGRSQCEEPEESPVLLPGDPAALAEVLAVGLAPHLLQDARSEVAVGRAIQVHGLGHKFLRGFSTTEPRVLRFGQRTSPTTTARHLQRADRSRVG